MKVYKIIAIKIVLIASIILILNTEAGKKYAEDVKPLIGMVLQQ